MKTTWCQIDGKSMEVYKDPKTDNGLKKSLRGLFGVRKDEDGKYFVQDQVTPDVFDHCALKPIFKDGKLVNPTTIEHIRNGVNKTL